MDKIKLTIKKTHPDAKIPTYATPGSAGADMYSVEEGTIYPSQTAIVDCGFAIQLPEGYEAQIRPRSGLALKNGITVLNAPGTVDSDYRGSMKVILHNTSQNIFTITKGMRIAQMIVAPVTIVSEFNVVEELDETARGTGGFGSSGKF